MASLISGFEYDIFISYRQKDNKGDRWVSEFVDALKTELESTFKEEISVYFDINPNDGLLETHDVDASLKEKLKCLVFIPIISRTYCDPKSFAWEHEFRAFVELVSQDQFGLKVKLPNGNVASRILPVRIYDLGTADIKLCETVLGGVLRSVDFIYKSTGVNRPLRSKEEKPQDNLNNTLYRDQINKVANSILEIITSIGQYSPQNEEVQKEVFKPASVSKKDNKTKIIAGSIIALVLIILSFFFVPKLLKPSEPVEKSVAVLPFTNLSNDPEQEYFSDGMVDEILDRLFKIGDLKVISRTSSMRYKDSKLPLKTIARELGVSTLLEGSVRKIGNKIRMTVQLIDAKTDTHLWSQIYDKDLSDIFDVQSDIAQRIAEGLKTVLTPEEKKLIEKSQTKNTEAYNLYLQGRFFWNKRTEEGQKRSLEYFEQAIAVDSNYALAYAGLADAYYILAWYGWWPRVEGYGKAKEFALRTLEIDKNLSEAHATLGGLLCWNEWKWEEARKELLLATELNPNYGSAHQYYSELLDILRQNEEARVQINLALELDPYSWTFNIISAINYYHESKFYEVMYVYQKLQEITPERNYYMNFFDIYVKLGKDSSAIAVLQTAMQMNKLTSKNAGNVKDIYNKTGMDGIFNWLIELELKESKPHALTLANWYARLDKKDEALIWLEKAFEERQPSIPRINNDPDYDKLRSEPRFQAIIKKMGLSDYQKYK